MIPSRFQTFAHGKCDPLKKKLDKLKVVVKMIFIMLSYLKYV